MTDDTTKLPLEANKPSFSSRKIFKDNYNTAPYRDSRHRLRTRSLFLETFEYGLDPESEYVPIFTLGEDDVVLAESNRFYGLISPESYLHLPEELRPLEGSVGGYNTIPSLRRWYLAIEDPKEAIFARTIFKSWYHWKSLSQTAWFLPYVEEWREALDSQIQGDSIQTILSIAKGPDAKLALAAAKWAAELAYREKAKKGRPTAREVATNLKKESQISQLYDDDLKRLGIQ